MLNQVSTPIRILIRLTLALALTALLGLAATGSALADEWLVTKLRGKALELVGDSWQPLERGDIVADARVLRTLANARIELRRGGERLELGPDTQVQIHDRDGRRYTVVQQYFGTVSVEAEARRIEHLAVQTPYLAAVVKGTRFEVRSGKTSSEVRVLRGHVQVEDRITHARVVIAAGQQASVARDGALTVDGRGAAPRIVGPDGRPVTPEAAAAGVRIGVDSGGLDVELGGPGGVGLGLDLDDGIGADVSVGGGGLGVSIGGGGGVSLNLGLGGLL